MIVEKIAMLKLISEMNETSLAFKDIVSLLRDVVSLRENEEFEKAKDEFKKLFDFNVLNIEIKGNLAFEMLKKAIYDVYKGKWLLTQSDYDFLESVSQYYDWENGDYDVIPAELRHLATDFLNRTEISSIFVEDARSLKGLPITL